MKKIILTLTAITILLMMSGCDTTNPGVMQLLGTDGNAHSINISNDGQLVINTEDVFQEISMHGELERKIARSYHILGRRAGFTDTSSLQDVKEFAATTQALFPVLTGAEALEVVSTSANDTLGGNGAEVISISYLDNNNDIASHMVSMNGTSPVSTNFTAKFIYSMEVILLGGSEVSVGTITLRTVVGSVIQEQITAGGNRSLSSHFMVPRNYTGYLVRWDTSSISTGGSTVNQDVRIRATVNDDGTLGTAYHFLDNLFVSSSASPSAQILMPYTKLPALTKVKVSTISSSVAATARIDSSYCVFIVHN